MAPNRRESETHHPRPARIAFTVTWALTAAVLPELYWRDSEEDR